VKKKRRLIKIGKVSVKNAVGFFWHDKTKIYVARTSEDVTCHQELHPENILYSMDKLEHAFRDSSALRFISWLDTGSIVRQGARQVTFDYGVDKVVFHVR
jgi:hypothetical protein